MAVWPRPCLERPLLRRLDGMVRGASSGRQADSGWRGGPSRWQAQEPMAWA